jgi:hypothetical protein
MARPLSWLTLIPSIQRKVQDGVRSHYELRDLQDLFKVGERTARDLLNLLPTRTIGNARLVEREDLQAFLLKLTEAEDPAVLLAEMRKGTRRPGVTPLQQGKQAKPEPLRRFYAADVAERMEHLPDNVALEVGRMTIEFADVAELVRALQGIAEVLSGPHAAEFVLRYEPPYCEASSESQQREIDRADAEYIRNWPNVQEIIGATRT